MRTRHLARLALGAAQLLAPGPVAALLTGTVPDRRARAATRVLGARHVTQGLVTASRPTPLVLGLGAAVDAAHGTSMVAVACLDPRRRRLALTDAVVATALAATGAASAWASR